jgi:hypothetical protein
MVQHGRSSPQPPAGESEGTDEQEDMGAASVLTTTIQATSSQDAGRCDENDAVEGDEC